MIAILNVSRSRNDLGKCMTFAALLASCSYSFKQKYYIYDKVHVTSHLLENKIQTVKKAERI